MITPRQLRAGRVLLGWTRARLARESGVPLRTTEAFEQGRTDSKLTTAHKWVRALDRAGVVFLAADASGGIGVRLREPFATEVGKGRPPKRRQAKEGGEDGGAGEGR